VLTVPEADVVSENNWSGFPFLFGLCVAASFVIWFGVDVQKGRRDAVHFSEERRTANVHAAAQASELASEESEESRVVQLI